MDQNMGKAGSNTEEVLYVYFELITTKTNKICKVANHAKLTGASLYQYKKGMRNGKEVPSLLGKRNVSSNIWTSHGTSVHWGQELERIQTDITSDNRNIH